MQRLDFEDVGKQLQVHDVVGGEFNFHKTCCLRQSCCHTRPQSCWIQSCRRGIWWKWSCWNTQRCSMKISML
jgi:hypothetical protein